MDIWAWVEKLYDELTESGHERVADLLYSLPSMVCEDKIQQAQALFPEALSAAKTLKNPWMEVFFRHWQMRLRLGALAEGETALPEVVSLLDFAHSDACRECPQSVCVTQDVASCYAYVDGPGWAPERKAVCLETLERINPQWNCYSCITSEYADALADEGDVQAALEYLEAAITTVQDAGKPAPRNRHHQRIGFILDAGRAAEALQELERLDVMEFEMDDDSDIREAKLLRARIFAHLGRWDDAWECLANWDADLPPSDYGSWTEVAALIMSNCPDRNNWQMGGALRQAMLYMDKVEAHRMVFVIGERHVRAALLRGASFTARRALDCMRVHISKLRAPLGADKLLEQLEKEVEALARPVLPVPAGQLEAYFSGREQRNPEEEVEFALLALEELPEDSSLLLLASASLQALGDGETAASLLWTFLEKNPARGEDVIAELISLIPTDDREAMTRLAGIMDAHTPFLGNWCRAHLAFRAEDWSGSVTFLEAFLQDRPQSIGARRFAAEAAMRGKDFSTAVRMRRELIARLREEGEDASYEAWDLMVAASAAQDWQTVRATCRELGYEVEAGDEPLDDPGAWVRIRYLEDGDWVDHIAVRTGPVTARILSVARPEALQRVKDWVVFEPTPLEQEPEDPEEKEHFLTPYYGLHTLAQGNYKSWMLDGVDPDMEEWQPFRDALEEKGYAVWVRSSSQYRVADPLASGEQDEDTPWGLPGIYVALGVPPGVSAVEADALITRLTKGWKHPLSWLGLAKDAGVDTSRHLAIIERYGLE